MHVSLRGFVSVSTCSLHGSRRKWLGGTDLGCEQNKAVPFDGSMDAPLHGHGILLMWAERVAGLSAGRCLGPPCPIQTKILWPPVSCSRTTCERMSAMDASCVSRAMHFQEPANKQTAISFLLCVWIVACIHGKWRDCVGATGKGSLPSAVAGCAANLIMQPDDGRAFCSEPVALHGWYMGGIASFWLNMFKNTELVRGPWCSVARVIG